MPRTFELLKIDLFKFPTPLGQNCVHIPHPRTGFDGQMPLLMIKCFQWWKNVAKIFSRALNSFFGGAGVGFWTNRLQALFHEVKIKYSHIPSKTIQSFVSPLPVSYFNTHKSDIFPFKWLHVLKQPRAFDRRRPKIHTSGLNSPLHPGKVKFATPGMAFQLKFPTPRERKRSNAQGMPERCWCFELIGA